jgi:S1-C subfamily serine protease
MSSDRTPANDPPALITCPNCRAQLLPEMRFCRMCGHRLGEGVAEYVETLRFDGPPPRPALSTAAASNKTPASAANSASANPSHSAVSCFGPGPRQRRAHWAVWAILGAIIASTSGGGLFHAFDRPHRGAIDRHRSQSVIGAQSFADADGGASLETAVTPDGPADKAGLVGGDVIKSFDGKPINNERDMRKALADTPIGKTVEVVYIRDAEIRKTTLTTISTDEQDRLKDLASNRPEGRGYLGISDLERAPVPGTHGYGVRLGEVRRNRPADIAGLAEGDIVIEFDGTPVRTPQELESRIARAMPRSTVNVVLARGNDRLTIPVRVGVKD